MCQIECNVMELWSQLSGFPQRIPQYVEVPPNIEAKPIGSFFPELLFHSSNKLLLRDNSRFSSFPVLGRPLAMKICMRLVMSSGQKVAGRAVPVSG